MKKNKSALIFLFVSLASFKTVANDSSVQASASLSSPVEKNLQARINLHETKKGIKLIAEISGLKPGAVHGFHIHEKGECKGPDFKSAGDHFNPTKHNHSNPAAETKHLGDLGNIVANDKGVARTEVFYPSDKETNLNTFIGKSVIIHAKADDLATQPSGNSGDRIACGIIMSGKI